MEAGAKGDTLYLSTSQTMGRGHFNVPTTLRQGIYVSPPQNPIFI